MNKGLYFGLSAGALIGLSTGFSIGRHLENSPVTGNKVAENSQIINYVIPVGGEFDLDSFPKLRITSPGKNHIDNMLKGRSPLDRDERQKFIESFNLTFDPGPGTDFELDSVTHSWDYSPDWGEGAVFKRAFGVNLIQNKISDTAHPEGGAKFYLLTGNLEDITRESFEKDVMGHPEYLVIIPGDFKGSLLHDRERLDAYSRGYRRYMSPKGTFKDRVSFSNLRGYDHGELHSMNYLFGEGINQGNVIGVITPEGNHFAMQFSPPRGNFGFSEIDTLSTTLEAKIPEPLLKMRVRKISYEKNSNHNERR